MPDDIIAHNQFAATMLKKLHEDKLLRKVVFLDEASFHISGKVNNQNVHIWGSEHPHVVVEYIRDSPRVNVWCSPLHDHSIQPYFFGKVTEFNLLLQQLTPISCSV
jgi:hypothetical protein